MKSHEFMLTVEAGKRLIARFHLLPVGRADCHLLPRVLSTNSRTTNSSSRILRFSGFPRKTLVGTADAGRLNLPTCRRSAG